MMFFRVTRTAMSRYTPVCFSSHVSVRQHFQQTGLLTLSTVQRSSGSPGAGADVRHFSFLTTSEEQKAEKRGQHGGKRGRTKLEQLERDKAFKINKEIVELGRDQKWKEMLSLHQKQKENFNNINYATTMSQLRRLRSLRKDDPLLMAFLNDLSAKLDKEGFAWMGTQGIGNIAHAIGKMNLSSNDSAMRIVRRLEDSENATWLFKNGRPQNIANCVWACAKLGIKSLNLFGELERNATWLVQKGTPQNIANCVWACAALAIESTQLLSEIEKNADWLLAGSDSHGVPQFAWAFTILGHHSPGFFLALEGNLDRFVSGADVQCLVTTCYAMAVLDLVDENHKIMLLELWSRLVKMKTSDFQKEHLRQMLYVKVAAGVGGISLADLPPELQRKLEGIVKPDTKSSNFEKQISARLFELGFDHQSEVSPFEAAPGMLSIDMASNDRKFAIECDGPSHYLTVLDGSGRSVENGSTKAKRRLLQRLGWKVVNLNWEEAARNQSSTEWLRGKLEDAGVELGT